MFSRIDVNVDCGDVDAQAEFWAAALGYSRAGASRQYRSLVPPEGVVAPKLVLQEVPEPRVGKNRLHLDVIVGLDNVDAEVSRMADLGATQMSERIAEAGTEWVVMADPEGNEFCICAV
jgi:predicted enzyme related to lactoylglutathione lyase